MIMLKEIDRNNFWRVCELDVEESQRWFVAPNSFSLAQSKYDPECRPLAVYDDDTLVGFGMYGIDDKYDQNWIHRFMIDKRFQGKGYGKQAFRLLIEAAMQNKGYHELYLSVNKDNPVAQRMYEGYGFVCNGDMHGDERVMVKQY